MYSECVIFVAFATLAQSFFCVQSSTDFSFLSEDADSGLIQLTKNQALMLNCKFESIHAIFDVMERLLIEQVYDMTPSADYNSAAKLSKSLSQLKEAHDYSLSAVLIAARKTACDAVDEARRTSHSELKDMYAIFEEALEFVRSANSTEAAQDKLNYYETLVQAGWTKIVQAITDSVRTCAEITSTDELEVIGTFQKGMDLALCKGANTITNAVRYYAYAYLTKSSDTSLIFNLKQGRHDAEVVFKANVENMYSMLNAVYINSYLRKTGLVTALARIQSARIIATYRFNSTVETLFAEMNAHLFAKSLGASPVGEDAVCLDEAAVEYAIAEWNAGTREILSSIESDDASTIEDAEKKLNVNTRLIIASIFRNDIVKSGSGSSDVVSEIKTLRDEMDVKAREYGAVIFGLIANGKELTRDVRSRIETLLSHAINQLVKGFVGGLVKAYLILTNALSGNSNVSESIGTLSALKSKIVAATTNAVNDISSAQITALLAE